MSTTTVRIPVDQELWIAVRTTGAANLQALIEDERIRTLFAAAPTEIEETIFGRDRALIDSANRLYGARLDMQAAIVALAKAEIDHVMQPKAGLI